MSRSIIPPPLYRNSTRALASLALLLTLGHADVKMVVRVRSEPAQAGERGADRSTVYFQGNRMRIERDGGVTIYDGLTDKTYMLNTRDKVCFVTPEKMRPSPPHLKASRATGVSLRRFGQGPKETLLRLPVRRYVLSGSFRRKAGATSFGPYSVLSINCELWAAEGVALSKNLRYATVASLIGSPEAMRDLAPLFVKGFDVVGLPLAGKTTLTFVYGPDPAKPVSKLTFTTEVESISQAPLNPSLFDVPKDYEMMDESLKAPPRLAPQPRKKPGKGTR